MPLEGRWHPWSGKLWVQLGLVLGLAAAVAALVEFALLWSRINQLFNALPSEIRAPLRGALIEQAGGQPRPLLTLVREQFLLSLGIGVAFSVSVALLAALRFSAPLEDLAATARRIATGDFAVRSQARSRTNEVTALIEDVNAMAAQLERLEANRRYSDAAIAHELRTPLTAMRTRIAGLADGVFSPEPEEFRKLHRQLDVLERLANDLQTLSLADVGNLRLDRHELDWHDLAAQVIADLDHRQQPRVCLEPGPPVKVRADAARLRQVTHNLLENALKYGLEAGVVRLSVVTEPSGVGVMRVADGGPGVPEADLEQIFGRYYRAEGSRSREAGGSGLGLTIVRALVDAHDGTVLAQPFVTAPIIGANNLRQLEDSMGATELTLSPDDIARISSAAEWERSRTDQEI